MRKDSIDQSAIEKAYLIYKENGHKIVDYDFSHPPTDYARNTVQEPEHTSKLREAYNELLPRTEQNSKEFNALAARDDQIESEIDNLQDAMKISRSRGNFQMLQNQMKKMHDLIKEKERIDAKMSVANLGGAQMDVYQDTMCQDETNFSEIESLSSQIASLEERMREFMGE